jgi:hypothetical protein
MALKIRQRRLNEDEHIFTGVSRAVGLLGPRSSSFTLAWLASHRDRLTTLMLGGKRVVLLLIYDKKGGANVERTDGEVAAIGTIVYGEEAWPSCRNALRQLLQALDSEDDARIERAWATAREVAETWSD